MTQNFSAKTIEEAKALAARAFGAPISDIEFEVIEEPKKGFFGFGKGNATVRATYVSIDVSTVDRNAVETTAKTIIPAPVEYDVTPDDLADQKAAEQQEEPSSFEQIESKASSLPTDAVKEVSPIVEKAAEEVAPIAEKAAEIVNPIVEKAAEEVAPVAAPIVDKTADTVAPVVEKAVKNAVPVFEEKITAKAPVNAPSEEEKRAPLQLDEDLITGEPSAAALEKIEKAKTYLLSILSQMGVEAELVVNAGAESAMIDIVSANSGTVIGKRGETLDALQYLTFMIANRGDKEYYRIILNSANYRERRRKTLEELAAKIARNVLRSGRQTTLEPMNPYERRIIHSAIAEIDGVSSRSVGEEPYRKVVISSTNARPNRKGGRRNDRNDRNDRRDRGGRDRRNNRDRRRGEVPSERISLDSMKSSFEKDYKRPKAEDEINAGLYGKIEF